MLTKRHVRYGKSCDDSEDIILAKSIFDDLQLVWFQKRLKEL